MSGKLFILRADSQDVATRVVVSADAKGLAELVGALWKLRRACSERTRLGTLPDFQVINLSDLIIVQSTISHISLNGSELIIQVTGDRLQQYSDLIEAMITSYGIHQYLDADTRNTNIDVIISIGEYSDEVIKQLITKRVAEA